MEKKQKEYIGFPDEYKIPYALEWLADTNENYQQARKEVDMIKEYIDYLLGKLPYTETRSIKISL